jgi:H+/Na+-translocating ferredoxin:NAD+ oxidoreductase subunit B
MDITFKKKKDSLAGEVALKSRDLEESREDFQPEIENCVVEDRFITISPECVRCNLCVQECPVNAIKDSTLHRTAKILNNCVKCDICSQTCPIRCIHVMETTSQVEDNDVKFHLHEVKVPHRRLRMKSIEVNPEKCDSCAKCEVFCPTSAINVPEGEIAHINKDYCVGCGACSSVCPESAINLERELGPVVKTRELQVDQDTCVQCLTCEEKCPVEAIKIVDEKVVLDQDKCILCEVCSTKCPVGALNLKKIGSSKDVLKLEDAGEVRDES